MNADTQWRTRALVIGGALGALIGVGTAFLLVRQAEKEGRPLRLGTGEGLRLGMLLMGMIRQVARLGDGGE